MSKVQNFSKLVINEMFNDLDKKYKGHPHLKKHLKKITAKGVEKSYVDVADDPDGVLRGIVGKDFYKRLDEILDSYIIYHQNYKNRSNEEGDRKFDIMQSKTLEEIIDVSAQIKKESKLHEVVRKLIGSNKYKKLMDDKTKSILLAIIENDSDMDDVKQQLSKIATYDSTEKLNNALSKILDQDKSSLDDIIHKISEEFIDADIVYRSDTRLALAINDFDASEALGSSQWCISSDSGLYEEYLSKPDSDSVTDNSVHDENYSEGKHIFFYDFEKSDDDPLSFVAFTIAANSKVCASHDKNDSDILDSISQIVGQEVLTEISKKVIDFDVGSNNTIIKLISNNDINATEPFENNSVVICGTRNPLNIIRFLHERVGEEIRTEIDEFCLSYSLLSRTEEDFFEYRDLDTHVVIDDLLWLNGLVNSELLIVQSYEDELDENEEEFFDQIGRDYSFKTDFSKDSVVNSKMFKNIFEDLNDIQKNILFETNSKLIKDILSQKVCDIEHKSFSSGKLFSHGENYSKIDNFILPLAPLILNKSKFNLTVAERSNLIASYIVSENEFNEDIEKEFLAMVNKSEFHINKVFASFRHLPLATQQAIPKLMNNNMGVIESVSYKAISELTFFPDALNSLNKDVCLKLNQSLRRSLSSSKDLNADACSYVGRMGDAASYPSRMKSLSDLGILDDEIIDKKITSSRMPISVCDNIKKEHGVNIIDYIKGNKAGSYRKAKSGLSL
jgi:hypothetical protein